MQLELELDSDRDSGSVSVSSGGAAAIELQDVDASEQQLNESAGTTTTRATISPLVAGVPKGESGTPSGAQPQPTQVDGQRKTLKTARSLPIFFATGAAGNDKDPDTVSSRPSWVSGFRLPHGVRRSSLGDLVIHGLEAAEANFKAILHRAVQFTGHSARYMAAIAVVGVLLCEFPMSLAGNSIGEAMSAHAPESTANGTASERVPRSVGRFNRPNTWSDTDFEGFDGHAVAVTAPYLTLKNLLAAVAYFWTLLAIASMFYG